MRVSHYAELADRIVGGIGEAVKNQRKALDIEGVRYTESPDLKADIIHLSVIGPRSFYYALRSRLKDTKLVINVHTTMEDTAGSYKFSHFISKPFKYYLKVFYSQADLLVTPSDYTTELMKENYGVKDENVKTVSNGVDKSKLEDYNSLREESREKHDLGGDVVFCVGNVFERKGLSDFIKTAEKLPELDFVWFGKMYDDKIVSKQTRKQVENAPENVKFTGFVDDIREAFAAGDIFFYPTLVENQGIPAFESCYCQKPMVIRDIKAFDRDFTDEKNCLKGEDAEEFSEEIRRITEDDSLREKISKEARKIYEKHSLETVGAELHETYRELLEDS